MGFRVVSTSEITMGITVVGTGNTNQYKYITAAFFFTETHSRNLLAFYDIHYT